MEQLFLRWTYKEEEQEDSSEDEQEADPLLDDLFARRQRQHLHQTSSRRHDHDRFLPRFWTPEEEVRVRRILRGSEKRPWYRRMMAGLLLGQRAAPPPEHPGVLALRAASSESR